MAGLLDFLRRAAPGAAPVDPMAGSVMSPDYIPETDRRQLALGGLRGLLDVSPVGLLDAATSAINRANVPSLAAVRAVTGRQGLPGDAMAGLLGQGGGAGYEAARSATQAVVPMLGLLGGPAGGEMPMGYARYEAGAIDPRAGRAPTGGTRGVNDEFYKGGQFLPGSATTVKGAVKYPSHLRAGKKAEVAPYEWALRPEDGMLPLRGQFAELARFDRESGQYVPMLAERATFLEWLSRQSGQPAEKLAADAQRTIEAFNRGARWFRDGEFFDVSGKPIP